MTRSVPAVCDVCGVFISATDLEARRAVRALLCARTAALVGIAAARLHGRTFEVPVRINPWLHLRPGVGFSGQPPSAAACSRCCALQSVWPGPVPGEA